VHRWPASGLEKRAPVVRLGFLDCNIPAHDPGNKKGDTEPYLYGNNPGGLREISRQEPIRC
jgi:hypothetical protein